MKHKKIKGKKKTKKEKETKNKEKMAKMSYAGIDVFLCYAVYY